jgi:hypothetical protein
MVVWILGTEPSTSLLWKTIVDTGNFPSTQLIATRLLLQFIEDYTGSIYFLSVGVGTGNVPTCDRCGLYSVRFMFALTYLYDIIVFSSTFEQRIRDLDLVLSLVGAAVVTLTLAKCRFTAPEVPYLGYIVGREGLRVDESKIASLQADVPRQTKTGIKRI